jgi:hypothetical protein
MKIEKIFVNVLDFIPDSIIQKRSIKLPISEAEFDKYVHDIKIIDASIFKQIINGIDLNIGDTIIYKGKVFDVNVIKTPDNSHKFIILKVQ